MLLAIITAWLAYKRAKENGRSGGLWGLIGAAVFIGTQFLTAVALGVGLAILVAFGVVNESIFDDVDLLVRIAAIAASVFASWLLLRYLDRPSAEEIRGEPPPPPSFNPQ